MSSSSRTPAGRHQKGRKPSASSPQKPVATVEALFRKQLQQRQVQTASNTHHADDDSDDEPVLFVKEEQTSVCFSADTSEDKPEQKSVNEGGDSGWSGGENRVCGGKGRSTGRHSVQRNTAEPQRRLSRRLSLKKASEDRKRREEVESRENTGVAGSNLKVEGSSQGGGSETCTLLGSKSAHSRSEPANCVSEAEICDTDCDRNVGVTSSVPPHHRTGTKNKDQKTTVSDSVTSYSSNKSKLSLKRKHTSEDSPSANHGPKLAKIKSRSEKHGNGSVGSSAAESEKEGRSSPGQVFSIFKQSSQHETSFAQKGSESPPTSTDSTSAADECTESPATSSAASENAEKSVRPKKFGRGKDSGRAKNTDGRDGVSEPISSEAGAGQTQTKAADNVDDDDAEDTKEETLYRVPYYLENFNTIKKSVFADDYNVQLFNEADLCHVEQFNNLSEPSQKLYVRLFSRKLAWLTPSRVKYPEIAADLTPCLHDLVTAQLLLSGQPGFFALIGQPGFFALLGHPGFFALLGQPGFFALLGQPGFFALIGHPGFFALIGEQLDDLSAILAAMSAPDLRTLAKSYHVNPMGQQKGQIIQTLVAKSQQSTVASLFGQKIGGVKVAMLKRAKKLLGPVYRLCKGGRTVFVRAMMLHSLINTNAEDDSGSGGQGQLFQMLMVNMGRVIYPDYTVNRHTRIFSCRQDLIRLEEALQLESELLGHTSTGSWKAAYSSFLTVQEAYLRLTQDRGVLQWDRGLPEFLRSYTAGSVLVRLLNQGVEILQRRKEYGTAVALLRDLLGQGVYKGDLHGYWWDRLALNLDVHLKQPAQALQAIEEGLEDPQVRTGHRLSLFLRAEAICTRPRSPYSSRLNSFEHDPLAELPKMYVDGRVLPHSLLGSRYQFITSGDGGDDEVTMCNVEHIVLDYYRGHGFPQGIHAEGWVVSTLFCLCLWDALFMDVRDAFHSPCQSSPLDLHTDAFYQRRRHTIDARLTAIEQGDEQTLQEMVAGTWEKQNGVMCAGINWDRFTSVNEVQGLVSCMGGRVLAGVVRRYVEQPRHTRGGFPDLTLWNTATRRLKVSTVEG
ncbi:hypothetical protein ACOMHN_012208 [Nucella lapillus]